MIMWACLILLGVSLWTFSVLVLINSSNLILSYLFFFFTLNMTNDFTRYRSLWWYLWSFINCRPWFSYTALGHIFKGPNILLQIYLHSEIQFTAALFTKTRKLRQPRCPLSWINNENVIYLHNAILHTYYEKQNN